MQSGTTVGADLEAKVLGIGNIDDNIVATVDAPATKVDKNVKI